MVLLYKLHIDSMMWICYNINGKPYLYNRKDSDSNERTIRPYMQEV